MAVIQNFVGLFSRELQVSFMDKCGSVECFMAVPLISVPVGNLVEFIIKQFEQLIQGKLLIRAKLLV